MNQTNLSEPTVLVLTALPVEMNAVLEHIEDAGPLMVGSILCEVGRFRASNGLVWRIAAAELGPGTVDTATAVASASASLRPDVVLFVGIAGAVKDDVVVGDVVAATSVAWTERGKSTERGYQPRVQTVSLSYPLSQWARRVARDGRWKERSKSISKDMKAVVGQVASSEKVVSSEEERARLRESCSDAIAIENEGFGMARAAETYSAAEAGLIRGISDLADGNKCDDHQQVASSAAAAFAFELLDVYSSVQATSTELRPLRRQPDSSSAVDDQADPATTSSGALAHELINDVDMMDDNRDQVESLAESIAGEYDTQDHEVLIGKIGAALQQGISPLIARRLQWFGRQLFRSVSADLNELHLDEQAKAAPYGMALLLTEPTVWSLSPANARRRCLTAFLGPSDTPHLPSDEAIRLISPLLDSGALTDVEAARVRSSFDLAPLHQLLVNGVTLDKLAPRIIEDLDSGDFGRQNEVSRFLYSLQRGQIGSMERDVEMAMGAKLVEAGTGEYHSFGAVEALALQYVSAWPGPRIAGGIWGSLIYTRLGEFRRSASEHLPTLLAATAGRDELKPVLTEVRELLQGSVRINRFQASQMLGNELMELAARYQGADRIELESFADLLKCWPE